MPTTASHVTAKREDAVVARLDRVLVFLAEAQDLQAVKQVIAAAEAAKVYARQVEASIETVNRAVEIRLRAERRLGELLRSTPKAKGSDRGGRTKQFDGSRDVPSNVVPTLREMGVSKKLSSRAQMLAGVPAQRFEEVLKAKPNKELLTTRVIAQLKQEQNTVPLPRTTGPTGTGQIVHDLEDLVATGGKFACIYADPPWKYDNDGSRGAADRHYQTMTPAQIAKLPVAKLATKECHLWIWTPNAFLFECQKLFEAWGFVFKSSFVWCKRQMGLGNYLRNAHEFLLLAVRGELVSRTRDVISWGVFDRTAHSEKPEQIRRDVVERISPGPRLELFGRRVVPGWVVFGDQVAPYPTLQPAPLVG